MRRDRSPAGNLADRLLEHANEGGCYEAADLRLKAATAAALVQMKEEVTTELDKIADLLMNLRDHLEAADAEDE